MMEMILDRAVEFCGIAGLLLVAMCLVVVIAALIEEDRGRK